MSIKPVYIVSAKRTAIGSLLGSLSTTPASQLGAKVIKSILEETKVDSSAINEVILGQVITAGVGQNPARQALITAGIPKEIPAFTINKVCGSGLKAVCLAAMSISLGDAKLIIAGGQENMSLSMHATYIRQGRKLGDMQMTDLMQHDGLIDAFSGRSMGNTAENIARQFNISREIQDEFAVKSHTNAAMARNQGYFKDEIIPIEVMNKKQTVIFDNDEGIRPDTSIEGLAKLKPAFEPHGSVTAGNASTINDGAACLMIASEEAIKQFNLTPLARIASYATAGVDPNIMGIGPIPSSRSALAKAGWQHEDLDLIECNEAFAAQSVYVNQEMGWDVNKVNVNGGAIAIGHPIGASGARVLVTLLHQMKRQKAKKGLVTMCIGGGMGIAMCVEEV